MTVNKKFRYIYGPVFSWRLGVSLGIDTVSGENKICSFDCSYCQIGPTKDFRSERKVFVPVERVMDEIKRLPPAEIDYITFAGCGEPTLAAYLGGMISSVRTFRKEKIAVITNSSLLYRKDVARDLLLSDFVIAKLDAYSQKSLEKINNPVKEITFELIVKGIKEFRQKYRGRFALQIMFIGENKDRAAELAELAGEINPDEVQINTPLRRCGEKPLPEKDLVRICEYFKELKTVSVYNSDRKEVKPVSDEETLKRRGKT